MVRAPALAEKPTVLRRLPVSVDHSEGIASQTTAADAG